MSAPRAAAHLLRVPLSLGYSFRPLLRGRGRRSVPSLPSRQTHTRRLADWLWQKLSRGSMLGPFTCRVPLSPPGRGEGWVIPLHCFKASTLTHPADSSPPALASASHACKSASSPRPCAPTNPALSGCPCPAPTTAWQSCVAIRAASLSCPALGS